MCVVLPVKTRTARKSQHCFWCRTEIAAGERYVSQVQVEYGSLDALKFHVECDEAWMRWWNLVNPDGYEECLDPWESDDVPIRGSWTGQTPDPTPAQRNALESRTERQGER